jgi:hypothetical protein
MGPELEDPHAAVPRPTTPTALPQTLTGAAATMLVGPVETSDPWLFELLPVELVTAGPDVEDPHAAVPRPATATALPQTLTGAAATMLVGPVEITDPVPVDEPPVEVLVTDPELDVGH